MIDLRLTALVWVPFALSSLGTSIAYRTLWRTEWYWIYLSLLGVLSLFFAALVLKRCGFKFLPLAGVIVGLLLGQWWFIQSVILQMFWHFSGFAP